MAPAPLLIVAGIPPARLAFSLQAALAHTSRRFPPASTGPMSFGLFRIETSWYLLRIAERSGAPPTSNADGCFVLPPRSEPRLPRLPSRSERQLGSPALCRPASRLPASRRSVSLSHARFAKPVLAGSDQETCCNLLRRHPSWQPRRQPRQTRRRQRSKIGTQRCASSLSSGATNATCCTTRSSKSCPIRCSI